MPTILKNTTRRLVTHMLTGVKEHMTDAHRITVHSDQVGRLWPRKQPMKLAGSIRFLPGEEVTVSDAAMSAPEIKKAIKVGELREVKQVVESTPAAPHVDPPAPPSEVPPAPPEVDTDPKPTT